MRIDNKSKNIYMIVYKIYVCLLTICLLNDYMIDCNSVMLPSDNSVIIETCLEMIRRKYC